MKTPVGQGPIPGYPPNALEREVIKICADQVPMGMRPACHLGVRSLNRCFGVATE